MDKVLVSHPLGYAINGDRVGGEFTVEDLGYRPKCGERLLAEMDIPERKKLAAALDPNRLPDELVERMKNFFPAFKGYGMQGVEDGVGWHEGEDGEQVAHPTQDLVWDAVSEAEAILVAIDAHRKGKDDDE